MTLPDTDELIRYDNQTGLVANTVTFPADANPYDVQVSPGGTHIYVTLQGVSGTDSGGLAEIDAATMSVTRTISLSYNPGSGLQTSEPSDLVLSPNGTHAYIFEIAREYVVDVDLSTGTVVAEVDLSFSNSTGPVPQMAITPDGHKLFVTQNTSFGGPASRLSALTTSSLNATPTVINPGIGILNKPSGIAVSPDGTKMFVTNIGDDYVNIFDPSDNTYLGHVLAQNPDTTTLANTFVTVSPDSSQFVVTNTDAFGQYLFYSTTTSELLYAHSVNPSYASGGVTATVFSPNGEQMMSLIYNDYAIVLNKLDPALGVKKPALAATGTNAAPIFIGAGILVLLGVVFAAYAIVLRKRRND